SPKPRRRRAATATSPSAWRLPCWSSPSTWRASCGSGRRRCLARCEAGMSGMDKIEKNGIGKKGRGRSNLTVAGICLGFFVGMVGMAYAAVPLYYVFCRVTGYGGTTQQATQYATKVLDREITVRFDTNTNGVPWDFKPVQREMRVKI